MSEILDMAHDMAQDLHEIGAMDGITMSVMDSICMTKKPSFTAVKIKSIRAKTRMSQPVFALFLNVGVTTVSQQAKPATGNPSDPSGATPKTKSAPLKSETPHEIGGQHV